MLPQIQLDREASRALHDQLADGLRELVLTGRLAPGARLPSSRRAAREFGVSRNVVVRAYERLQLEEYLDAGVGVGTWVRETLPGHLLGPELPDDSRGGEGGRGESRAPHRPDLSRRGDRLAAAGDTSELRVGRPGPFRPGAVDPDLFPLRTWARLAARVWRSSGETLVPYADPAGHPHLRERIADHVARRRGVRCEAGQVVVTAGSQQALDLIVRLLVDPGDPVMVEDPGYPGVHATLRADDHPVVPIPVDAQGLRVDALVEASGSARLLYTTPSHQYPLGSTLSLERRLRLLEWARRENAWIVEDDYDSEFRYGSRPLPSLQGLDEDARVLYVGTFSKVLAPGLRLGFVVVPPFLADACRAALRVMVYHPPNALQATLAEFMAEGRLERHLAAVRSVYEERRDALVAALGARLGDRVEIVSGACGLHLVVLLAPGADDVAVSRRADRRGVDAPALSPHYRGPGARPGLLLGFGGFPPAALRDGVETLARAIEADEG